MIRATLSAASALVVLPALLSGCDAKAPNASSRPQAASVTPCTTRPPAMPQPTLLPTPPPTAATNTGTALMTVETNLGTIEIDIDRSTVPCTAAFLAHLGRTGFYQGSVCDILTTDVIFLLQCGNTNGDGTGGPGFAYDAEGLPAPPSPPPSPTAEASCAITTVDENGKPLPIESVRPPVRDQIERICRRAPGDLVARDYSQGAVYLSADENGIAGSQFFFAYRDFRITGRAPLLGRVRTGMDIVMKVAEGGTVDGGTEGQPGIRLIISKVTVT